MTGEKAINKLNSLKDYYNDKNEDSYVGFDNEDNEALDLAIKSLEQQPCEDYISREAVDNYIVKLMSGYLYDEERARLEDLTAYIWELPSVIPSRPNGKWKRISPAGIYECTNCNQVIMTSDIDCYKYCHGCGVRMEGEE